MENQDVIWAESVNDNNCAALIKEFKAGPGVLMTTCTLKKSGLFGGGQYDIYVMQRCIGKLPRDARVAQGVKTTARIDTPDEQSPTHRVRVLVG